MAQSILETPSWQHPASAEPVPLVCRDRIPPEHSARGRQLNRAFPDERDDRCLAQVTRMSFQLYISILCVSLKMNIFTYKCRFLLDKNKQIRAVVLVGALCSPRALRRRRHSFPPCPVHSVHSSHSPFPRGIALPFFRFLLFRELRYISNSKSRNHWDKSEQASRMVETSSTTLSPRVTPCSFPI